VPDAADDRRAGCEDRSRHDLGVEGREVLQRAAPAHQQDHIDVFELG
jgi:hypothetical protein